MWGLFVLVWLSLYPRPPFNHDAFVYDEPRYYGFPFDALLSFNDWDITEDHIKHVGDRVYGWLVAGLLGDAVLACLIAAASALLGVVLNDLIGMAPGQTRAPKAGLLGYPLRLLLLVSLTGGLVYLNLRPRYCVEPDYMLQYERNYGFPFEAAYSYIAGVGPPVGKVYYTLWEWYYPALAGDALFAAIVLGIFSVFLVLLPRRQNSGELPGQ
jgi:hypothetical protein